MISKICHTVAKKELIEYLLTFISRIQIDGKFFVPHKSKQNIYGNNKTTAKSKLVEIPFV